MFLSIFLSTSTLLKLDSDAAATLTFRNLLEPVTKSFHFSTDFTEAGTETERTGAALHENKNENETRTKRGGGKSFGNNGTKKKFVSQFRSRRRKILHIKNRFLILMNRQKKVSRGSNEEIKQTFLRDYDETLLNRAGQTFRKKNLSVWVQKAQ